MAKERFDEKEKATSEVPRSEDRRRRGASHTKNSKANESASHISLERRPLLAARRHIVEKNSPRLSAASITPSAYTRPRTEVPVTSGCLKIDGAIEPVSGMINKTEERDMTRKEGQERGWSALDSTPKQLSEKKGNKEAVPQKNGLQDKMLDERGKDLGSCISRQLLNRIRDVRDVSTMAGPFVTGTSRYRNIETTPKTKMDQSLSSALGLVVFQSETQNSPA